MGKHTYELKEHVMRLPEIGEKIDIPWAIELCHHFQLDYLVQRVEAQPERYKSWEFDGCSGLPDQILGLFTGCKWSDITYKCCLPHDLCYAFGELGNEEERERVDKQFYQDLVEKAGMKKWQASAFLAAVRVGGVEDFGLSFSWGYAHKK